MSVNSLNASTAGEETAQVPLTERLKSAITLLEQVAADRRLLAELSVEARVRLLQACGKVYCSDPLQRRQLLRATQRLQKAKRIKNDQNVLSDTGIRKLRKRPVFTTPNIVPPEAFEQQEIQGDEAFGEVVDPQNCYICKQDYSSIHHFYDQLCPTCAALNFQKRTELADLRGRVALLTGGRVKIGYQAGVKLLRAGAQLVVTTRFPRDSAARYASEPDFNEWGDRLEIFGLDLRHTPSVEAFCRHLLETRRHVTPANRISRNGAIASKSSGSICAIPRAWKLFAGI